MNNSFKPKGNKVRPLSALKIRNLTREIRNRFNINSSNFPIMQLLETLNANGDLELQILSKAEMKEDGLTLPDKKIIQLREDVYNKACDGDGFGRFTAAHEYGHLNLHCGQSNYARSQSMSTSHKAFEDSEWQANCFSADLLMPIEQIKSLDTWIQIMERFGVSRPAAEYRLKDLRSKNLI